MYTNFRRIQLMYFIDAKSIEIIISEWIHDLFWNQFAVNDISK